MSTVSVEVHDRRHSVRVSPMSPLSAVVEAALAAEGVTGVGATGCKLLLGKKALDLSTPLRFANVPAGAKLQLITGQERRLGMGEPIAAPRLPDSPKKAGATPRAADAAAAPYTMAPDSSQLTTGAAAADTAPEQPAAVPVTSGNGDTASNRTGSAATPIKAAPAPQPAAASPAAAGPAGAAAGAAGAAGEAGSAPAGPQPDPRSRELLGRAAWVFSRAAAQEAAAPSAGVDDPPDSFYEFTADDYARVARGWGANFAAGPAADAPLKTARMRAADAAAAAQRAAPVPVRVYGFADDLALQATFPAVATVSALQELVERAVGPETTGMHLYTAPPKTVLQQPQATLYEAGLAPAAVVYVGCSGGGSPALRPDVAALQGPPPPRERQAPSTGRSRKQAAAASVSNGAPAAQQQGSEVAAAAEAPRLASGAKLPKWLQPKK